jgi:hypothetical protein
MYMPENESEDVITNQITRFPEDKMPMMQTQMTAIPKEVRQKLKELGYDSPINTAVEGQKAMDWFRSEYKIPSAFTGKAVYPLIMEQSAARHFVPSNKTVTPMGNF